MYRPTCDLWTTLWNQWRHISRPRQRRSQAKAGPKKPFCVPTDKLLRAKYDLLSKGGQSLNSIFADCFSDWFIGIPFVGDNVVAKCINELH